MAKRLTAAREAFLDVVDFVAGQTKAIAERGVRRLRALPDAGRQPGGRLAAGALAAGGRRRWLQGGNDAAFMQAKIATARFYADHILSKAPGLRDSIVEGADSVTALALEAF